MHEKLASLSSILHNMGSVVIAYSGGTDSTLLLKVARDVLGEDAVAVTVDSSALPRHELKMAQEVARDLGVEHVILCGDELSDQRYRANDPRRCYYCRGHIWELIFGFASQRNIASVVDGENADDLNDYRPGRQAASERGVRSLLREVGLTKQEIRALAREAGLPNWNKPSAACLASRVPYGTPITTEVLARIERAEDYLRSCGFDQLRVRYHGPVARLEVEAHEFPRILEMREAVVEALRSIGFTYVTLDLSGFRSGSMNETLAKSG